MEKTNTTKKEKVLIKVFGKSFTTETQANDFKAYCELVLKGELNISYDMLRTQQESNGLDTSSRSDKSFIASIAKLNKDFNDLINKVEPIKKTTYQPTTEMINYLNNQVESEEE